MNVKRGPISEPKVAETVRASTGLHIAAEASAALVAVLEEVLEAITREAVRDAEHAGRKTIKRADIEKAVATIKRLQRL